MSTAAKVVQRDVSWVTDAINRVNPHRLRMLPEILEQRGLLHKEFVHGLAAKLETMKLLAVIAGNIAVLLLTGGRRIRCSFLPGDWAIR